MKEEQNDIPHVLIFFGMMIILSLLVILVSFIITPDFVAKNFSIDGSLDPNRVELISIGRLVIFITGLVLLFLSILSWLFEKKDKDLCYLRIINSILEYLYAGFKKDKFVKISSRNSIIIFICIITLGLTMRVIVGDKKSFFHIDEVWALQFTAGSGNFIADVISSNDIYSISGEDINNKLTLDKWNRFNYKMVEKSVLSDPHPPLHYWIMHTIRSLTSGAPSKWPGIVVNLLFYVLSAIFLYKISLLLIKDDILRLIPVFLFTMAPVALGSIAFIRMYEMLTFCIIVTAYSTYEFIEIGDRSFKTYTLILGSMIFGLLTQYYFLIFLFFLYISVLFYEIRIKKDKRSIASFTILVLISGIVSLIINPVMINNVFFGSRGTEAQKNLTDFSDFLSFLHINIKQINYVSFSIITFTILLFVLNMVKKVFRKKTDPQTSLVTLILLPLILSFITINAVAPFQTVRYYYFMIPLLFLTATVIYSQNFRSTYIRYGLIFLILILLPKNINEDKIHSSMGSVFFSYNYPESSIGTFLSSNSSTMYVVEEEDTWKAKSTIPALLNKKDILILKGMSYEENLPKIQNWLTNNNESIYIVTEEDDLSAFGDVTEYFGNVEYLGELAFYNVYLLKENEK